MHAHRYEFLTVCIEIIRHHTEILQTHNKSISTASQTHCCAVEMKSCGQQCDLQPCFEVEQSHYSQKYQVGFVRIGLTILNSFQPTYATHSYDLTVQSAPDKVAMSARSKQRQRTPSNKFSVDFLRCVDFGHAGEQNMLGIQAN